MEGEFNNLGTRDGFNRALRHFKGVTRIVPLLDKKANLADIINEYLDRNQMTVEQIKPILNAVLVDRFGYRYESLNLEEDVRSFEKIVEEIGKWTAMDMVLSYHHSALGLLAINPRNPNHWEKAGDLNRNELMVVYAKYIGSGSPDGLDKEAIMAFKKLLRGDPVQTNESFIDKTVEVQKIEKKEVVKKNMTPKYSIQVTNELFHNGNVESWKNIVESYKVAHPDLEVFIFHAGEPVKDINSLFKWGKVKNGDVILFAVAGEKIRNVSKLSRYLFEGASKRFEAFLKQDVSKPLSLF